MASSSDAIVASSVGPSHAAAPSLGSQQSQHSQKLSSSESVRSAAHSVTAMSVTSSTSAPVLNAPAPSHAHPQPGWLNIDPRATGSSSPAPSSVRTGSRSAPSSPTRGFSALPHPGPAQVNQPATPKSSHATGHQAMSRAPPSGHDHAEGGVASADRDMLARLNDLRRNLAALGTALDAMPHGKERAILEKEYANLHKMIARESSRTSPTSPNSPSKNKGKDKARFSMSIRALFQGNPETRVQKAERALAGAVGRAEANGVKGSDRDSRRQRTQSAGAQMHRAALKHSVSHGQLRPPQSPFQRHPLSPQRQPPPQGPNNFYQHPARSVGTPGPGDHPFSVAPGQGSMRQRTQSEFGVSMGGGGQNRATLPARHPGPFAPPLPQHGPPPTGSPLHPQSTPHLRTHPLHPPYQHPHPHPHPQHQSHPPAHPPAHPQPHHQPHPLMGMQSSPVSAPPRNGPPSIPPSPSHSSHSPSPRSSLVHIPTSRSQPQLHQQMPMTREHRTSASPSPRNSLRPMPHPPQHVNPNQRPPFDPGRPQTAPHSQGPPFGHPPPQAHWPGQQLVQPPSPHSQMQAIPPPLPNCVTPGGPYEHSSSHHSPMHPLPPPSPNYPMYGPPHELHSRRPPPTVSVPHPMLRGQRSAPSHLTAYVPVPVRESAYESTQAGIQQEQGIGHLMLGSDGPDAETASEHNQESEVVETAEQGQRAGRSTPLLHEMFSATTRPKTAPSSNGYLPSPPQSPTQSLYGTPAQSPPISAAPAQGFFGIEPVASPAPMSDRPSTSLGISHAAPPTPRSSSSSSVRAATNIDAYVPRENMPPTAHPSPSPSPVQSLTETRVRSLAPGKDLSVSPSTSDSSSSSTRPVSNAFNHTRAPIFTSTGPLASHKPPSDPPGVPLWEFSRRLGAGPQSEPLTPVGANTNMEQRRPQLGEPMFCFALEGRLQLAVEGEEDAIEVRWAELRRIDDDAFLGYAYVDSRGEWRGWW